MNPTNNNSTNIANDQNNPIGLAIQEWGLQNRSPEEQADYIERIGRLVYQALLVRSLDLLTDEEQTELDLLLDEEHTTAEDVLVFLASKIPTFEILRKEEIEKIKKDILV
jgi:hypothetical protein